MLVNPYHPSALLHNFPDLDKKLKDHYDYFFDTAPQESELFERYKLITQRYIFDYGLKVGFRDIFYYINLLYDNKPSTIIDVGCGECIWKKYFPNIVGFDPLPSPYANHDFVDYFDNDYVQNNQQKYDAGMALNSVHFISWKNLEDQINNCMSIIKPGGRFLFTLNFEVLDNYSEIDNHVKLGTFDDKISFLDGILKKLNYAIIMLDYPYLRGIDVSSIVVINGFARIILEK